MTALALGGAGAVRAQQPQLPTQGDAGDTVTASESTQRIVSGRVLRVSGERSIGVPNTWVVLHRVGPDRQGPLDSVRTAANGAYTIRYRQSGRRDALYFLSVRYASIAYFSSPLQAASVTGPDAEITVYDTTSKRIAMHVRGRHLIVGAPRVAGDREIVEVFEISNDTNVTAISANDVQPTWTAILPAGVADFRPGEGDVPPDAIRMDSGRVVVTAPLAPGLKQVSFAYRLAPSAFPLSVPMEYPADVLEVLLEEPSATVKSVALDKKNSVAVEGRSFQRFLGKDVPATAVLRIVVPATVNAAKTETATLWIVIALVAAMLLALLVFLSRRPRAAPRAPAPRPHVDDADDLARRIAQLDTAFEDRARDGEPSDDEREEYERDRAALMARLAAALAARRASA